MEKFKSWDSYGLFSREVVRQRRYMRTPEAQEFLSVVAATCKARLLPVPAKRIFWRAQLGHGLQVVDSVEQEAAYTPGRMKPRVDRAAEGRANPKGIPCLYLSTTADAAISEVRPWVGAAVSLAQFEVTRPLTVVDCSRLHGQYFKLAFGNRIFDAVGATMSAPSPDEFEKIVWAAIDSAFSAPVTEADDVADYAPTQVLAELFRSEGYDGVAYKSAFGDDGFSVALFELDSARQLNGALHEVKSVKFEFSENPLDQYFIADDGKVVRNIVVSFAPVLKSEQGTG
jgi:RES domain